MGLIDRLFNSWSNDQNLPRVKLGRFTDAYKSDEQLDLLEQGREFWEKEKYGNALKALLDFLYEDDQNNVLYGEANNHIDFSVHQGSRSIYGHFSPETGLRAFARIARIEQYSIGYLRSLVERNHRLTYCHYSITADDEIRISLRLPTTGVHPDRLYFALKELSLHADKLDDLLIEEFSSLSTIIEDHQTSLPDKEIAVKLDYYYETIRSTLDVVQGIKASPSDKVKIQRYLGLALIYKLEYLISPEGLTRDRIEKIHHDFMDSRSISLPRRVRNLWVSIDELAQRDRESLASELYDVSTTFGLTGRTPTDTFKSLIEEHWPDLISYAQRRNQIYAQHICDYIIGYALFNFGLPLFMRQLLDLYYRVTQEAFFNELGFKPMFIQKNDQISSEARDAVRSILNNQKQLIAHTELLSTDSITSWSISYVSMIRQIL